MSLRETLETTHSNLKPGPKCGITKLRAVMPDDDRQALDEAITKIRDERAENTFGSRTAHNAVWLHRSLMANSYQVSLLTLQKHIAKTCACGY